MHTELKKRLSGVGLWFRSARAIDLVPVVREQASRGPKDSLAQPREGDGAEESESEDRIGCRKRQCRSISQSRKQDRLMMGVVARDIGLKTLDLWILLARVDKVVLIS